LDWITTDIEVQIKSNTFRGGQYYNATGVIREVGETMCKVVLSRSETISVPFEFLEPVKPTKKDRIKITRGELRGHTGSLIGIDGADGIVKMDTNLDIKILHLGHLARYIPPQ
jgi:transcription elongation factor SPT5